MKLIIIFVLSICAIMLMSGLACKSGSSDLPNNGMTGEQIYQNAQDAQLDCNSMHMEGVMSMFGTFRETWGEDYTMDMVSNVEADYDLQNMEIYMNMNTDMDMTTGGRTESQILNMQMYMVDGWMYMGEDSMGEMSWVKMDFTDIMYEYEQQFDSMLQGLDQSFKDLIKDAIEVEVLGEETVNGVVCWKLDIQPDFERVFDWFQTEMGVSDLPSDVDFGEMLKDIEITTWVDKDMYYPVKVDETITMNIEGSEFDMSGTMTYSKFNQPVTIILPEEALEAEEVSY